jgi:hypothetical protein
VTDRAALFVRLPSQLASRLDAQVEAAGRSKQAVVSDLLAAQLDVHVGTMDEEVLDLAETAALLRVDESEVLRRIGNGDFPARRLGDSWRCSRAAVLTWLAGTDPLTPRPTGFHGSSS